MSESIADIVGRVIGTLFSMEQKLDRSIEITEQRTTLLMAAIDDLTTQVTRVVTDVANEITAVKQAIITAAAGSPSQSTQLEDLAGRLGATADTLEAFTASLNPAPAPTPAPTPTDQPAV